MHTRGSGDGPQSRAPVGFEAFVAARSPALLRTAWLLTGDWASAQDLVQAALTRTWQRWDRIERQDSPEGYVRAVMVTTYATWWRRRWRAETPSADLPEPHAAAFHDEASAADSRAVLRSALGALPPRQRAVVVLRYFEDLSEAQIATLLGCSAGTVKSQASKALAKLRVDAGVLALIGLEVTP